MRKRNKKMLTLAVAAALLAAPVLARADWLTMGQTEKAEEEHMMLDGIALENSYKKAGENNPLYTQRFGADPGVMEYDGRIYVYMTNDIIERDSAGRVQENSYSKIRHISCISSDDMVNWTDHGLIPVAGKDGIAPWAVNSWAPCAAHKTVDGKEKFFLYFCNGGNGIGVLAADSPTGPWRDELGHLLITRETPNCANVTWLFDPAVMVDEDGAGYLAFGGGVPEGKQAAPGTGRIVRLGADMMSLDCDPVALDVPWLFEDSGINRIGDTYYYTYCSNWQTDGNDLGLTNGAIQYMTASDPLGPYTYQGELFPNEGRFFGLWGNNHHSIGCLNGQYYLFYHARPVEAAMGITGNYRSPQADKIEVNADGSLRQVTGTMAGISQLNPLMPFDTPVSAATMADQAGIEVKTDGEKSWIAGRPGSWIRIADVYFGEMSKEIVLSGSAAEAGTLYIMADGLEGEISAKVDFPAGENWEVSAPIEKSMLHDLYIVFGAEAELNTWMLK